MGRILDAVLEVELRSFLWNLLSVVLKQKKFDFPGMKAPGSPTEPANFKFSTWLTWRGIKLINHAAFQLLLDRMAQIVSGAFVMWNLDGLLHQQEVGMRSMHV